MLWLFAHRYARWELVEQHTTYIDKPSDSVVDPITLDLDPDPDTDLDQGYVLNFEEEKKKIIAPEVIFESVESLNDEFCLQSYIFAYNLSYF